MKFKITTKPGNGGLPVFWIAAEIGLIDLVVPILTLVMRLFLKSGETPPITDIVKKE